MSNLLNNQQIAELQNITGISPITDMHCLALYERISIEYGAAPSYVPLDVAILVSIVMFCLPVVAYLLWKHFYSSSNNNK
jgi:hypothetical protein